MSLKLLKTKAHTEKPPISNRGYKSQAVVRSAVIKCHPYSITAWNRLGNRQTSVKMPSCCQWARSRHRAGSQLCGVCPRKGSIVPQEHTPVSTSRAALLVNSALQRLHSPQHHRLSMARPGEHPQPTGHGQKCPYFIYPVHRTKARRMIHGLPRSSEPPLSSLGSSPILAAACTGFVSAGGWGFVPSPRSSVHSVQSAKGTE